MDRMTAQNATPRIARWAAILLFGSLWLGSSLGCGAPANPSSDQAPADDENGDPGSSATDGASDDTQAKLRGHVEVPHPDITNLDEAVQQQLGSQQSALAALRELPGVSEARLSRSYGEMGMLYHTYALYDAAEACYRNAQALAPRTFRWPYYLGKLHAREGDVDSAVAAFKQVLSIKADDVPALVSLAQTLLAANRLDEATPFFDQALAEDAACATAHVGLGKIAALRREHKLAAQHFKIALELVPDATAVHYALAMAYRNLKQPGKAVEHIQKRGYTQVGFSDPLMAAVRALPVGAQHHVEAGAAAANAGKMTVALKELRKALQANPDNSLARLNLGIVLARSGDRDGAIQQYHEAIRLRPKFALAYRELAAVLTQKGAYDDALPHFIEAVTCDPQQFDAHWGLAELALMTGKHELAVTHYALAVKIDPRHVGVRRGHVVALTTAGRHADALDCLEKSREVLPRSVALAHAAARLWATCPVDELRDGPKALELAQAVFRTRQCIEHAETLAMAFAETGNYDQARQWQNKTIEMATTQNRGDAMPRLKKNLALYENGKPCRTPW